MSGWGPCWGYVRCPQCKMLVPVSVMEEDRHVCDDSQLAAAEVDKARKELEDLDKKPDDWANRTTEFLRWLKDR